MNRVRCAIYTRKSSDEGLDQAFNSLDAQREACEAYIQSQKHEGWKALPQRFDDGGLSGGTLERPALTALLEELDAGRIDMIVVYKIDRLTRSLADFAKLVERLDEAGASFVSVTQQFNTSTSMGRLTLNVLLSFAQFEREVTAERIRDKIAASKKKGMWMGGLVPLGYDKSDAGLVINAAEAETVRALFDAYLTLGCVRKLKAFADERSLRTKTRVKADGSIVDGVPFSRGRLYHLLSNPIYIGKIQHKTDIYDGLHEAIISDQIWERVQALRAKNGARRGSRSNAAHPSPLAGRLFDEEGTPLTPSHATKAGRRYRYYVSQSLVLESGLRREGWRIPAVEIEAAILGALAQDRGVQLCVERAGRGAVPKSEMLAAITRGEIHGEHLKIKTDLTTLGGDQTAHTTLVPFTLRRRGVETKLVLEGSAKRHPDLVLVRRTLRAMSWLDQIKAGRSVSEVARAEDITPEYITHNIDLALLSPRILKAMADGEQRPDLSAYQLSKQRLPADWSEQETVFLG